MEPRYVSENQSISHAVARRILRLKEPAESDAAFAERVGLSPQLISNYRMGRHGASLEAMWSVADATDVSCRWLLLGTGPQWDPEGRSSADVASAVMAEVAGHLEEQLALLRENYGVHLEK